MENGKTIGTRGSEEGVIVLDEEHVSGARVCLEQGGLHGSLVSHLRYLWGVHAHRVCGLGSRGASEVR